MMAKFDNDYLALRALETRLQSVFNGEYAGSYSRYNGVDVRTKSDEDEEPENIGRPLVLLDLSSGDRSDWSSAAGAVRQVTVSATTFVTDNSGGTQGAANPVTSDEQLSRDLVQEIESNRTAWEAAGLYDMQISPGEVNKGNNTTARRIEHRVTFHYFLA